jgi:Glycosyltransferase family 18
MEPQAFISWTRQSTVFRVTLGAVAALGLMRLVDYFILQPTKTTMYFNHVERTTKASHHRYCSSHINSNMTVLFAGDAYTWPMYYDTNGKAPNKGGENYLFASLDWALQQLGVTVVQSRRPLRDFSVKELEPYHRIFNNGAEWAPALDQFHIRCKHRPLHFWGNYMPEPPDIRDARQMLVPYPEQYNTFVGYFAHSLVHNQEQPPPPAPRLKQGLLMGKSAEYFSTSRKLIDALINDGFVLYSTCQAPNYCGLPDDVIIPPAMGPREFANLLSKMAFLIGFGDPLVSPSPLEGLALGAAWLNPHRNEGPATESFLQQKVISWTFPSPLDTQHNPIALLGPPYVYNIHLNNITDVLQAANNAFRYRFSSYVPADFRPQAMIARVCTILDDDSICECPLQLDNEVVSGKSSKKIQCKGTTYIRNPKILLAP